MSFGETLISKIAGMQDKNEYRELNWEGSFSDYLDIIRKHPGVVRSAFQRTYDMIIGHGKEEYIDNKKSLVRSRTSFSA